MKFKIDENLPHELCDLLRERGHDADSVYGEGLKAQPDAEVWRAAIDAGRALVATDLDFSDIRKFTPGTHPGIVLFRIGEEGRAMILARFDEVLAQHDADDWARCFVVIGGERVRVRRPPDAED